MVLSAICQNEKQLKKWKDVLATEKMQRMYMTYINILLKLNYNVKIFKSIFVREHFCNYEMWYFTQA